MNKKDRKNKKLSAYILRLAFILVVFTLFMGTAYGIVKIFKLDEKFKDYFDIKDEDIEDIGLDGNDIGKTFDFDKAKITVKQTIVDEKEVYLLIDIEGKDDLVYLDNYTVDIKNGTQGEGFVLSSTNGKINSYLLNFAIDIDINYKEEITIHLDSDNNTYDITFDLLNNGIKEKSFLFDDIVYTNKTIEAKIKEVTITPFKVMIAFQYNKNTLSDEEIRDIETNLLNSNSDQDSFIEFMDGKKMTLRLDANSGDIEDTFSYYDKYEKVVDIDTIKSIVINGKYFNLKEENK